VPPFPDLNYGLQLTGSVPRFGFVHSGPRLVPAGIALQWRFVRLGDSHW
jgi:hypothetical protein